MKVKTLKLKNKNPSGGGSYGEYFKLSSQRGIKILAGRFNSYVGAIGSPTYAEASAEAFLLKVAEKTKLVPKCYGVQIVQIGKRYAIGIVMQHLGGRMLEDTDNVDNDSVIQDLEKKMKKHGFEMGDLHAGNVMYYKRKYWVIDFTPEFVYLDESR